MYPTLDLFFTILLFTLHNAEVTTIRNLPSTSESNVSFYLEYANDNCTSNWIDSVSIWNKQAQNWVPPTAYTLNTKYGDRYTWDCSQSSITNCQYSLPISILLPTIHLNSMNERNYHSMTISNVISNFNPDSIFETTCDICESEYGDQICTAVPTPAPTPSHNIIIENHPDTQEWWVAIFFNNVNISCGEIVNVEISDNYAYKNKWVKYDENVYDEYGHYEFKWQNEENNAKYTLPLSVRITMDNDETNATEMLYSCNIITDWNGSMVFDFGSNSCQHDTANTINNCPMPPSTSISPISSTLIADQSELETTISKSKDNNSSVKYFNGIPMDYIFWGIVVAIVVFCLFICCCATFCICYYCKRRQKDADTDPHRLNTHSIARSPRNKKQNTISMTSVTLTPGKCKPNNGFMTPSANGYASLEDVPRDIGKKMTSIDLNHVEGIQHIEHGHNRDLLVQNPFQVRTNGDGSEDRQIIHPMTDSEALYDENRIIKEPVTECTALDIDDDDINEHVIDTRQTDQNGE